MLCVAVFCNNGASVRKKNGFVYAWRVYLTCARASLVYVLYVYTRRHTHMFARRWR